jgi:NitT/TauT family transport system permease protein
VRISLAVLLQGYAGRRAAAFALTTLAVSTQIGRDLLDTLTSMFNPLPAIALLPLACCGSAWAAAAWCSC